jgi:hypothetical protein
MHGGILDAPGKTVGGEIASGLGMPLQRHQHMGQGSAEQFRVEKVVGLLKAPVFGGRDRLLHVLV